MAQWAKGWTGLAKIREPWAISGAAIHAGAYGDSQPSFTSSLMASMEPSSMKEPSGVWRRRRWCWIMRNVRTCGCTGRSAVSKFAAVDAFCLANV